MTRNLTEVERETGIPKDSIREMLQEIDPALWEMRGARFAISDEAVSALLAAAQLPQLAPPQPREQPTEEILQIRSWPQNTRLLMAQRSTGEVVIVRVRDNRKIKSRCFFSARMDEAGSPPVFVAPEVRPLNPGYVFTLPQWKHLA